MKLTKEQIQDLIQLFQNEMNWSTLEWIVRKNPSCIANNLMSASFGTINMYSQINKQIIQTTLEQIISAFTSDDGADYFFFSNDGTLRWCKPEDKVVPGDALKIKSHSKLKAFLRNIKLEEIGI